jgi:hypothetical protein
MAEATRVSPSIWSWSCCGSLVTRRRFFISPTPTPRCRRRGFASVSVSLARFLGPAGDGSRQRLGGREAAAAVGGSRQGTAAVFCWVEEIGRSTRGGKETAGREKVDGP